MQKATSEHQLLLLLPLNWNRMCMRLAVAKSEITFYSSSDWRIIGLYTITLFNLVVPTCIVR